MKNLIRNFLTFASVLSVAGMLAACSSDSKTTQADSNDGVEYYQTREKSDVRRVSAKMYTRGAAGESRMGEIRFHETESGLKMDVDLKDMRPGVDYSINVYRFDCPKMKEMKKMKDKKNGDKTCAKEKMSVNLPTLRADASGAVKETFMIHGFSAKQLKNAKIVLSRDGNDKAAWGRAEKTLF
ncbi:MAG: hypothetical protein LBJ73_01140 [Rickettsiales bacterium]|jgi:Cu/Zn superoxide dismutase|nr:hypothetical protein [Rickettsiales bacterium]